MSETNFPKSVVIKRAKPVKCLKPPVAAHHKSVSRRMVPGEPAAPAGPSDHVRRGLLSRAGGPRGRPHRAWQSLTLSVYSFKTA